MPLQRNRIRVQGIVQGVGFRPFVYRLAAELDVNGWVCNNPDGVSIEIQAEASIIETFLSRLVISAPSLASIDRVETEQIDLVAEESHFQIQESCAGHSSPATVPADQAACPECLQEMLACNDRRFRYPFINCTQCGPRFSLIQRLPYDRPNTTMVGFELCADCTREYSTPSDRRFHAQPIACPQCGPQVWFVDVSQVDRPGTTRGLREGDLKNSHHFEVRGDGAIHQTIRTLSAGGIVAIKGIGGFHLACDASNESAVERLRQRKNRPDKPLAVMAADQQTASRFAKISLAESRLLKSSARPILLLEKSANYDLADSVASGNSTIGVMLPYAPLHWLLLKTGDCWVMTSGNLSDEPIAYENETAWLRLKSIADGFLFHDRPIHAVCDDSVVRLLDRYAVDSPLLPIRRSRGYVPLPIPLNWRNAADCSDKTGSDKTVTHSPAKVVLAVGGELKTACCLGIGNQAILSQHLGDMGNQETLAAGERAVANLLSLYEVQPSAIVGDLHPGYLSTAWGRQLALKMSVPFIPVQHHHAHAAALMAENYLSPDQAIIACVFDGTGYGTDKAIWGGEWLIADYNHFRRFAQLDYVDIPGGDLSIRDATRSALAYLAHYKIEWKSNLPPVCAYTDSQLFLLKQQIQRRINVVPSSSMGRLFDAVAAIADIRQKVNFEGQAAIELEYAAADVLEHSDDPIAPFDFAWKFSESRWHLDSRPMWIELIRRLPGSLSPQMIAARFHQTIVTATVDICLRARVSTGLNIVGLTGGVFQNILLTNQLKSQLQQHRFQVLTHARVPPNDGGLSLGQAVIGMQNDSG